MNSEPYSDRAQKPKNSERFWLDPGARRFLEVQCSFDRRLWVARCYSTRIWNNQMPIPTSFNLNLKGLQTSPGGIENGAHSQFSSLRGGYDFAAEYL